jgi:pimeloyl-ACP methyl ester carboxylesterase
MPPSDWLASGHFFTEASNPVFYRMNGSGPETILMLHGFPTASWDWHKLWPVLEKDFRLIALDMLGYGFSSKPVNHNRGKRVIHLLIQYLHERKRYRERWVDALQRCPVPLRLINGNFDPISGKQMSVRFRELVEIPDMVDLPDIGHYPQTEAPWVVLQHYLKFLDRAF